MSDLIIRGHAMLSHEGLTPERETLEYAWQMEILLGKISARLTPIQVSEIEGRHSFDAHRFSLLLLLVGKDPFICEKFLSSNDGR